MFSDTNKNREENFHSVSIAIKYWVSVCHRLLYFNIYPDIEANILDTIFLDSATFQPRRFLYIPLRCLNCLISLLSSFTIQNIEKHFIMLSVRLNRDIF